MRLVRLRVANFGCVRSADIDFGERLNVLYGRNDLGKSSLVAAIRAALFLQHDSSVHRPYVTWTASEQPHVELTLQARSQRYYRIKKTFGSKGRSILEESKDGTVFLNPIKGRQVDGVIRTQLLPWGIPEPGGKRRERSMPSSFLSAALLAEQTEVTALFDRQFASDGDESGKQLLADALQATARDPLFTDVLHAAQLKVDEAFTATGRRKRGRASPFYQIAQDITSTKAALDEAHNEAEEGDRVRAQLTELNDRILAKHSELEDAENQLDAATEVVNIRAQLGEARAEMARIQDILDQAQDAQDAQAQAIDKAETLRALRAASDDEVRDAKAALERARAQVAEANNAASGLQTRLQALDLERADLERRLGEARSRQQTADMVRRSDDTCTDLGVRIAELEGDDRAMMARIRDREQLAENEADLHVLNGVALLLRWREADEQVAAGYEVAVELAVLMTEIEDARNQADELEVALLQRALPDHETVAMLRELDAQVRVAKGALSVGLSAVIESALGLRMEAIRDDGDTEDLGEVRGQVEISAERELTLSLPNLATIRITGGNDMNRARVRRTQARWRDEAVPVLQAAGVDSLTELDAALDEYGKDVYRLRELRERADKGWEKAEMLRKQLLAAEPLRKLRAELDEQLDSYDRDHVSDRIDSLEDECTDGDQGDIGEVLKGEMDTLSWDIEALRERVRQAEVDAAEDKARLDGLRARLSDARSEYERLSRELDEPWADALAAAETDMADCRVKLRALDGERAQVVADSGDALEHAEAAVRAAEQRLQAAEAERARASSEYDRAKDEQTRLNYECEHKTSLAEKTDISGHHQRVDELSAALQSARAKLSARWPQGPPDDVESDGHEAADSSERLQSLRAAVDRFNRDIRDIEREREQALGALRGTGGERLRERVHDLSEQYRRLERAQLDLEFDYDAWKLLLSTLREVEREQAAHLGRAMVEPITARFRELTADRYGALDLGPNLETHGIHAGGERRDVSRLSVGTKEQLSTLFRLSLAEILGSAVLLDDQLTQTDPQRMDWFRDKMHELSQDIQIIVFTCRVGDYLGERKSLSGAGTDEFAPAVRAIRLDDLIDRV